MSSPSHLFEPKTCPSILPLQASVGSDLHSDPTSGQVSRISTTPARGLSLLSAFVASRELRQRIKRAARDEVHRLG